MFTKMLVFVLVLSLLCPIVLSFMSCLFWSSCGPVLGLLFLLLWSFNGLVNVKVSQSKPRQRSKVKCRTTQGKRDKTQDKMKRQSETIDGYHK